MTSAIRIPALKSWQMQYGLWLTGTASAATKAALIENLARTLENYSANIHDQRIASVDMGIRNLAFCVVEPSPLRRLRVTAWQRQDLLSFNESERRLPKLKEHRKKASVLSAPGSLSEIAVLVTKQLLSHSPDTILIEHQRHRTASSPVVQEWTILVNMLESMLYASLETLRSISTRSGFPDTQAMDPARVTAFWNPRMKWPIDILREKSELPRTIALPKATNRFKMDKKMKVDLVRSWIAGEGKVDLEFSADAAPIAEAFKLQSRQKKEIESITGGKLDDLADCLLQAVAWVKWHENRRTLREMWTEESK